MLVDCFNALIDMTSDFVQFLFSLEIASNVSLGAFMLACLLFGIVISSILAGVVRWSDRSVQLDREESRAREKMERQAQRREMSGVNRGK